MPPNRTHRSSQSAGLWPRWRSQRVAILTRLQGVKDDPGSRWSGRAEGFLRARGT